MPKILSNTKIAKQNRARVKYHREWNKILIRDSIRSTSHCSSYINKKSSSSQGENIQKKIAAQEQLRRWALKYNISKYAVTALLKILISIGLSQLPADSRSLFQTERKIKLSTLTNGKLW